MGHEGHSEWGRVGGWKDGGREGRKERWKSGWKVVIGCV